MSAKIIDRIQKLLKLAANAGSENEAALAAERAAQLMEQHEIHEAQLSLDGHAEVRAPEPIERCYRVTDTSKRVAWHMNITHAVADTYGARAYWHGGAVVLFGRLSTVQAASYTSQYLMREIERLTDRTAPTRGYSRAYRNAFRLGASNRVAARLRAQDAEHKAERERVAARGAAREVEGIEVPSTPTERAAASPAAAPEPGSIEEQLWQGDASNEPEPGDEPEKGDDHDEQEDDEQEDDEQEDEQNEPEVVPTAQALAIIDHDRKEVSDKYKEFSKKWRKGHSIGNVSSGGGYSAGRAAGDRVNIANQSRGGLPKGQDTLRKGRR